jgi:membrane protease YdiL (CAAX protease family)
MSSEPAAPPRGWRFIDLAELGVNTGRSYAVTLLCVVLSPLVFLVVVFIAINLAAAARWLSSDAEHIAVIGAAFVSVLVAGGVLAWSVAHIHQRPWMSLVSTEFTLDWRRLAIGAGVEGILLLTAVYVGHLVTGQPWRVGSAMSPASLAFLMLLVPFQAASEEMLFRGYLTQALGRIFRNRAKIVAAVGLIFGAMHFNAYGLLTLPYLFGLSIIFSLVSLHDERLELAIGGHMAMNWVGVAVGGAFRTSGGGIQLHWAAIALLVVHGVLFYGLTRILVRLYCERRSPR